MSRFLVLLLVLLTPSTLFPQNCDLERFNELKKMPTSSMTNSQYEEYARLEKACNPESIGVEQLSTPEIEWKMGFVKDQYFAGGIEIEKTMAEKYVCSNQSAKNYLYTSKALLISNKIMLVSGILLVAIGNFQNIENQQSAAGRDGSLLFVGIGLNASALFVTIAGMVCRSKAFDVYNKSITRK